VGFLSGSSFSDVPRSFGTQLTRFSMPSTTALAFRRTRSTGPEHDELGELKGSPQSGADWSVKVDDASGQNRAHRNILIAACLLLPTLASANPVMLNPCSLLAFYVVVFWSFVVEARVVALLLAFQDAARLRVFTAYFVANAAVFFFLFQPLLMGSNTPQVLALEALVVLLEDFCFDVSVPFV